MPTYSELTVKFLTDFEEDYSIKITLDTVTYEFDWVASRSSAFEVTTGSPTGNAGETSAINFEAAFDLDLLTGYVTTVQNTNEVLIQNETQGVDFTGIRAVDDTQTPLTLGVDYDVVFNNVETPVDISNVDFILARSPHYVNTPFNFSTTTSATIQVFIWSGDLASVPVNPTYTLTKVRPSTNFYEFNTNISELVRENLDPIPNIVLSSTTQVTDTLDADVKWIKYVVSYTDAEETIPDIEGELIGIEGYGYFMEGVNPTKPTDNILTSSDLRKVDRTGFILLPYVNNGTITSIDIDSNGGEINDNIVVTSSDNSNKAVQYLSVDVSQTTNDSSITVTFNPSGDTVNYVIEDECRYMPKQVVFKNRYGLYECMTLFKKNNETLNVTSDDFTNAYISAGAYSTTAHQRQKINIQATETISVQSGYVSEQENALYKEALLSDKIYFYEDGTLIPVNIKSSSLEFKTRINDRLVNYQVEFEYAYNTIQNI